MKQAWRWFGPDDPVTLDHVKQAGASGIVTALHHRQDGTVWPDAEVRGPPERDRGGGPSLGRWSRASRCPTRSRPAGATPPGRRPGSWSCCGRWPGPACSTVCYNFMPVVDWTRTDLMWRLPTTGYALRFDAVDFAAYDLFILRRPGRGCGPSARRGRAGACARGGHEPGPAGGSRADYHRRAAPRGGEVNDRARFERRLALYARHDRGGSARQPREPSCGRSRRRPKRRAFVWPPIPTTRRSRCSACPGSSPPPPTCAHAPGRRRQPGQRAHLLHRLAGRPRRQRRAGDGVGVRPADPLRPPAQRVGPRRTARSSRPSTSTAGRTWSRWSAGIAGRGRPTAPGGRGPRGDPDAARPRPPARGRHREEDQSGLLADRAAEGPGRVARGDARGRAARQSAPRPGRMTPAEARRDGWARLPAPNHFALYSGSAQLPVGTDNQMQNVAVGLAGLRSDPRSPLALALVGAAGFLPAILLALVDRPRRRPLRPRVC